MELSTEALIKEAKNRQITVEILDEKDNFIRLTKDNKIEYIKQATKTSADTYISTLIMENKEVTKLVLREKGINVPKGYAFHSQEDALTCYDSLFNKSIVIKPNSTNFGEGVVIIKCNTSFEAFKNAIEQSFKYDSTVLIEEFAKGREFRFLVIGDQVAAVLHRVPANVTGDGNLTIEQLVQVKNQDPLRGKGYSTPLEKLTLGFVEIEFLKSHGKDISYIPKKDETVYLRENSNISTGGDSIDYTDDVLQGYKDIAVKAAQAVGAKICGADIMIEDIHADPTVDNYCIIELNFNPALHIHDFPYKGKNRQVEKKVLDLLGLY